MKRIEQFKAALLDVDGLMFSSEEVINGSFKQAVADFGGTFTDEIHARILGTKKSYWLNYIYENTGISGSRELFYDYFEELHEKRRYLTKKMPGLDEILHYFNQTQTKVVLVTSSSMHRTKQKLEKFGLTEHLKDIVTGEMVENGKPAPDAYLLGARTAGFDPELCVAFEDAVSGTKAASTAGSHVISIPTVYARHMHYDGAHHICDDLHGAIEYLEGDA